MALKDALDCCHFNEPQFEVITSIINRVLTLSNFTFIGTNYLQIKGCAIGTIAAPSYATIFIRSFEETFIYQQILADCLMHCRFIAGIFLICTFPETTLINLIADLNTRHESIKFDYEISETQIAFLDTVVYIDKSRRIQTTLFKTATDRSNYYTSDLHTLSILKKT